jgi:hypothetical protein
MFADQGHSQVIYSRHLESKNNSGNGNFLPSYGDEAVIGYFKYLFDNKTDVVDMTGQNYLGCIVKTQGRGPCSL